MEGRGRGGRLEDDDSRRSRSWLELVIALELRGVLQSDSDFLDDAENRVNPLMGRKLTITCLQFLCL